MAISKDIIKSLMNASMGIVCLLQILKNVYLLNTDLGIFNA